MVQFSAVIIVEGKYSIPRISEIIAPNSRSAVHLLIDWSELVIVVLDNEDGTTHWSV